MVIDTEKCDTKPERTCCLQLKDTVRADCCRVYDPIPVNYECFLPDIKKAWEELQKRHQRMFVKRKRLMEMALPLRQRSCFVPKCTCKFEKSIQIVLADPPMYTRTEQLAYPLVRRLIIRKDYAQKHGDVIGTTILNRVLRYSYMSLYSRLANIQPQKKKPKKKKLAHKEMAKHARYNEQLAKPKQVIKPPKIERKVGEINARRLKKLAKPKQYVEEYKEVWQLTDQLRTYKASKRIKEMALPKERDNIHINDEPNKIEANALKYKASARIKELAQPSAMRERKADTDVKEEPFTISANALKYKASARIKELAEPKEYENAHIRDNPFFISPAALKAKASPRIIELAKPKGS